MYSEEEGQSAQAIDNKGIQYMVHIKSYVQ